jgi:Tfp pilus assembly protein PilX
LSRRSRAFTLLIVLLFSGMLLMLASAYLTRNSDNYRSATYAAESLRAYEHAMAGLESARVRLDKDPTFPPAAANQDVFSCCEPVYEPDAATVSGYYTLTVDTRWQQAPYHIIRVSSVGSLGPPGEPQARRKVWAELDVDPAHAATYFEWVHFRDEGSL